MRFITKYIENLLGSKGIIFLDQALVSGSNFLVGILLVRWIGLENYGVFALLWMVVLFALGINQAFITKPLLSIAPKMKDEEQGEYLEGIHTIQLFFSATVLFFGPIIYFILEIFLNNSKTIYLPVLSGIVFCQLLHDFYRKINFVKNQTPTVFLIDIILYGGQLVGLIGLIWFNQITLFSSLLVLLGVNILSILLGFSKQKFSFSNIQDILIRHFHFSKWLLGTSILQWLSGNYFIIVGASILGTSAVGAIRMVQNIMGLCHILFLTMENIIPIEAARRFQMEGENGLILYLNNITKKLGLGFCIILIGIALFSSPILSFIYGEEARQFSFIVLAYVLLYVFVFIGHPFRFYLRTIEKTSPIFFAYIFGTIFSLGFAHILINQFEMNGLLFGLIFTQIISVLTYYFYSMRNNKISFQKIKS